MANVTNSSHPGIVIPNHVFTTKKMSAASELHATALFHRGCMVILVWIWSFVSVVFIIITSLCFFDFVDFTTILPFWVNDISKESPAIKNVNVQ
jgi:hypothetical protein